MRYVNGLIGLWLVALALMYIGQDDWALWTPIYGTGALIALLTLKPQMSLWMVWSCAIIATAAMFFFFAFFFQMAPHLKGDWFSQGHESLLLLISAFCMIPVLSEFSCRMKTEESELKRATAKKPMHTVLQSLLRRNHRPDVRQPTR